MKTVLLLRHAKSDWSNPALDDFERPLAKRGLRDAPLIGQVIAKTKSVPELIISSPAERARQTAELVAETCSYDNSFEWDASFYGGGSEDLISALSRLPNTVNHVMLVGHNPTMEETAADLLNPSGTGWNDGPAIRIPTAGLICVELHITDWAVLRPGDAMLRWFVTPKVLKAIIS
jgi:phosphohistidine phosphatase